METVNQVHQEVVDILVQANAWNEIVDGQNENLNVILQQGRQLGRELLQQQNQSAEASANLIQRKNILRERLNNWVFTYYTLPQPNRKRARAAALKTSLSLSVLP